MDLQSIEDSFFQDLASYQPAVEETDDFFEDVAFRELVPYQQPAVEHTNQSFDETLHRLVGNDAGLFENYPSNITGNDDYIFNFPDAFEPPISIDHNPALLPGNTPDLQEPDLIAPYLSGPGFTERWPHPITSDSAVELGNATNVSGYDIGGYGLSGVTHDAKEGIATSLDTPFDLTKELEPLLSERPEPQLAMPLLAPKSKRTCINKAAKKVLEEYFGSNPYPNEYERSSLVRATQLTGRTIKDWFSNTRSRKVTRRVQARELSNESTGNAQAFLRYANPAQSVCRASLEALEKHSPTASMSSLQRYIETPVSEEAIPKEALDAIQKQVVETTRAPPVSYKSFGTVLGPRRRATSSNKSTSVAGSNGSRGSARSDSTHVSLKSEDSRGSRRGRKLWKRAQQDANSRPVQGSKVPLNSSAIRETPTNGPEHSYFEEASNPPLLPYFCTWSDCSARFRFRWEWARHETALHYQPYHWVCCLPESRLKGISQCFVCGHHPTTVGHIIDTHFTECYTKDRSEVTFLREDQLIQHFKGVHMQKKASKKICKELLSILKTENHDLHSSALDCGFCGRASKTWAEREDHVSEHLKEGMCKSAWWVGRLPPDGFAHGENPTMSETEVFHKPSSRTTWSCRYLYDYLAVFMHAASIGGGKREFRSEYIRSDCRLCAYRVTGTIDDITYRVAMRRHAELHDFRLCTQTQFSTMSGFICHLSEDHDAIQTFLSTPTLDPWMREQKLTWQGEQCIAETAQIQGRSIMCVWCW